MITTPPFLTDVIARQRVLLTSSVFSAKLQFSEDWPKQHLFHYDSFQLPTPPSPAKILNKTANKILEVAF